MTREIVSGAEVLTAVIRQRIAGFDFAVGRVITGLLQFLRSGKQHPISGIVASELAYDAGKERARQHCCLHRVDTRIN